MTTRDLLTADYLVQACESSRDAQLAAQAQADRYTADASHAVRYRLPSAPRLVAVAQAAREIERYFRAVPPAAPPQTIRCACCGSTPCRATMYDRPDPVDERTAEADACMVDDMGRVIDLLPY